MGSRQSNGGFGLKRFHWRRDWLPEWLGNDLAEVPKHRYRVRILEETATDREQMREKFREVAQHALDDARERLRAPAKYSLDPLGAPDLAIGYPSLLHEQTLKGYLGETLAGLVAENFDVCGFDDWEVPAFLFRFHKEEFRQLERLRQIGGQARRQPGRTGDDCVAFRRDSGGGITAVLVCEAKCTSDHRSGLIADAHKKLNAETNWRPLDTHQLLEVVSSYDDATSRAWTTSLAKLLFASARPSGWERADCIVYVCGRRPSAAGRTGWLRRDQPHHSYHRDRQLEAVEIHLEGVGDVIQAVYGDPV